MRVVSASATCNLRCQSAIALLPTAPQGNAVSHSSSLNRLKTLTHRTPKRDYTTVKRGQPEEIACTLKFWWRGRSPFSWENSLIAVLFYPAPSSQKFPSIRRAHEA